MRRRTSNLRRELAEVQETLSGSARGSLRLPGWKMHLGSSVSCFCVYFPAGNEEGAFANFFFDSFSMNPDEEDLGEKYDRYLEQRLQINNEVDLLDLESDEELNRNTFDVGDVSTDFDFSATGSHNIQHQPNQRYEAHPPALSLAEIEEMMRNQAHAQRQQMHYSAHYPPPPAVQSMSLEEVEKQMRMQMAQNLQPAVRSNLSPSHQPTVLKNDNPITMHMEQKLSNLNISEIEPKQILKRSKESKQRKESTLPASKIDESVILEPVFNELEFPTLGQVAEKKNQKVQQPALQPSRTIQSHPKQNQKQRKQQGGSRSNFLDLVDDLQGVKPYLIKT